MKKKSTKQPWFTRHKSFFIIPMSPAGWVIMVTYVTLNALYFVMVNNASHSLSDTIFGFLWFLIASTICLYLVVINHE